MRLLDTRTRRFEEFIDDIPPYAILSHTWGADEISFAEMVNPANGRTGSQGYDKIDSACLQAQNQHQPFDHIWIDTCCIDKSSSAELTEAINAMYTWYAHSEVCYAYLSDLEASAPLDQLGACRWFTRGWTLQELIAPKHIIFFDREWNMRGTKEDLAEALSHITGIDQDILLHRRQLSSVSVAQKMSWAAYRRTTRVEDTAYCLLGIFGVHLPFVYGEGERAFRRLQDTIVSSVPDLSIFAWKLAPPLASTTSTTQRRQYSGVYAPNPAAFAPCRSFTKRVPFARHELLPMNGSIVARMQILIEMTPQNGGYRYLLPLDCHPESRPDATLCVRLRKLGHYEFVRENPYEIVEFSRPLVRSIIPQSRYLLPELPIPEEVEKLGKSLVSAPDAHFIGHTRSYAIQMVLPRGMWFNILDILPGHRFDGQDHVFYLTGHSMEHDSAMARLTGGVLSDLGERVEVDLECVFCAAGWSSSDQESLQCTVLDYSRFAPALSEFRTEVCGWDFHRNYFLERLIYHKMPRASSVTVQGRRSQMRISFVVSLVEDPSICRNRFWRIEFSCAPCEEDSDAQELDEKWNLDSAAYQIEIESAE
ncbi:HET-domain-containing protein [Parathielavia hyrcaniae]|uniref:HET-domain-containing protein n=1 Tax=Parathielavia hyrcaniae TaxID=113614 RepID=A0AAN6T3N1_9PEZI|nr:HET-domain-containing protein [Parathielavia hyrcaniae]